MDTITTITIEISASFAKQTTVFEDSIQQREDESDSDFLKRAAIVLEVMRIRSK